MIYVTARNNLCGIAIQVSTLFFLGFAGCTHDKYIGSNNYINVWVYKLKVNIILYIFFYKSSDFLLSIRLEISLVGFFTIFPLFIERF